MTIIYNLYLLTGTKYFKMIFTSVLIETEYMPLEFISWGHLSMQKRLTSHIFCLVSPENYLVWVFLIWRVTSTDMFWLRIIFETFCELGYLHNNTKLLVNSFFSIYFVYSEKKFTNKLCYLSKGWAIKIPQNCTEDPIASVYHQS